MKTSARILIPALTAILCATGASSARAQGFPGEAAAKSSIEPGDELVVTFLEESRPFQHGYRRTVRGEYLAMAGEHLIIDTRYGSVVIDTASVRTVRRRIGTKPASAPAMALGSAAGFLSGFLIGSMTYQEGGRAGGTSSASNNGLALGVLLGAPAGALVAWLASRSRPIYENVPVRPALSGLAVDPTGRVGLSFTIPTR